MGDYKAAGDTHTHTNTCICTNADWVERQSSGGVQDRLTPPECDTLIIKSQSIACHRFAADFLCWIDFTNGSIETHNEQRRNATLWGTYSLSIRTAQHCHGVHRGVCTFLCCCIWMCTPMFVFLTLNGGKVPTVPTAIPSPSWSALSRIL